MRPAYRQFAVVVLIAAAAAAAAQPPPWLGEKLADYLQMLNDEGLRVIYSSNLVTDSMRLGIEPDPGDPASQLAELLRPFGLRPVPGPAGSLLVVRIEERGAAGQAESAEAETFAEPIPEIVVTSSLHRLDYSSPGTHTYLDRELVTRIPATADEAVRLTQRLPGTASGGVSTRNHVRGGEVDETLFLFDGLRLYEPYHLKDFQAIATIVNSNAIGGMDFYTGAYPAHFGDRMSGVLNIELRTPEEPVETEIALSFFNTSLLSTGRFGASQQGDWLVAARRGNLDLIVDLVDPDVGSPDYQDYLAHVSWEFGPRTQLSANILVSDDKLRLADVDRGEIATADYENRVFWAKWAAEWSEKLASMTILAISDIADRRDGVLDLPGIVTGSLNEDREFDALELRQDWRWVASESWMLRFGVGLKDLDAHYRFTSDQAILPPFDSILDNRSTTSLDFDLEPSGSQYAAYTELRWRPAQRWTFDFGLRWDQQNYTTSEDDRQYSPRASVLYEAGRAIEVRLGWGQYYQAQEINELQVSDGITEFFPAQRAEHFVLNVRTALPAEIDANLSVYRKSFRTLRPRFENAFNTLTLLPELQFDRVMVDPNRAEAVGVEFTLTRGTSTDDLLWWMSYAWAEVEDETGDGDFERSWDQTHTVKGGVSWRWGAWDFSAAAEVHTGWPTTRLTGAMVEDLDGGTRLDLEVTPRNGERFSVFHTLDVRVSRSFDVSHGELTTFLEISNLYDQANPCCTEYSLAPDGSLNSRSSHWLPLVPSLGIVWRF